MAIDVPLKGKKIPLYLGGRFTRKELSNEEKAINDYRKFEIINWIDNGPTPKDYTSLILNIISYRISNIASLDSQMVMSVNGQHIYIVVKADEADICWVADEVKYNA